MIDPFIVGMISAGRNWRSVTSFFSFTIYLYYFNFEDYFMITEKHQLMELLKISEVTINFTKKDGTERVLVGTLDPARLPVRESTESKERKEITTDAIAVYDIENQGWRSFNFANVNSINGEPL